ncbi:MAG: hypothetical protein HXL87_02855 [[Eubacterium] sulci]|jgi:hypothetical protein|nr:hypothetical protein [[Eubacterium] sulci]MBF1147105.1 hypothetical protein [[Eubacterium] sulci]MBF1168726.1 hypothetical protein [[Eubacterium] sulci]MBF1173370.1 hypothetical protein [[Eubacterium] sulci]
MKKMDEMDRNIRMRSERWGYRAALLSLCIWTLFNGYQSISKGTKMEMLPCLILCLLESVQFFSELLMKRKMVAGDEEYKDCKESNLIFEVIIGITMTIFLIIYGGAFILATAV